MNYEILIIGAGISGVLAAKHLTDAGYHVAVLEKSRGTGGRMATRRQGDLRFDHGAQFITVRRPEFREVMDTLREAGKVSTWCQGFGELGNEAKPDGHPRYCGSEGMSRIVRHLADGLQIHFSTRAQKITSQGSHWKVTTDDDREFTSQALLLSSPLPQTLELLKADPVGEELQRKIGHIEYDRCFALLLEIEPGFQLPEPGGFSVSTSPIEWIANNNAKGINPNQKTMAITVHSTPKFAETHWEQPLDNAKAALTEATRQLLPAAQIIQASVHRWGFSKPRQVYPERYLGIPGTAPLALCGDAFGGPKVEGAALSGLAAAAWLKAIYQPS